MNKFKPVTMKEATFTLSAEIDDLCVHGNAIASGDPAEDTRVEDEIIERLNNGDVWAWASVTVTAHYKGVEGRDHLGGCSYKDEVDFKQQGGYYDDMKTQALEDLNANLLDIHKRISARFEV